MKIEIHTPRAESDLLALDFYNELVVEIHTPRTESDQNFLFASARG
mgnify:FL=1